MSRTIDPIQLAQFMVLPGAADLVEAFSAIRPGPMRDSIVHLARTYAESDGWSPTGPFAQQEQQRALPPPQKGPKHLTSPFAEDLSAASTEGQIVERLMRGEAVGSVAVDLGVSVALVERLMRTARREGGVVFPGDELAKANKKAAQSKGGKSRAGSKLVGVPVPPPPYWWEDAASPVWLNPNLLPVFSEKTDGTMAGVGPMDRRSFKVMADAAARHGMTLQAYVSQRIDILQRVERGEKPSDIALALGIMPYGVYGVLNKVGRGRMQMLMAAGAPPEPIPASPVDEQPPEPEPAPEPPPAAPEPDPEPVQPEPDPEPVQARVGSTSTREASAHASRVAAAAKFGFADVEAYEHARSRVRQLRLTGMAPAHIANRLDQPYRFVKNALDHWRDQGQKWPDIDIEAHKRHDETAAA